MANEITKILDVITPEVFNQYMQQYSTENSAFIQSGVAVADERVSKNITAGGTLVNMPFWNDLNGDDEVLDDGSTALETAKITSGADIAAVLYRGKGWSVNELAAVVSGDDPMRALLDRIGAFWLRQEQKVLTNVLNGLFASSGALANTHLLDISGEAGAEGIITASSVLDAKQKLGDAANKLAVIVMHSAVFTKLQKDNFIEYIQPTQAQVNIPTYLGYRVVVDDALAADENGVYTTYLLAEGAFGRNTGTPANLTAFETDRDAAAGNDRVFTRRAFVMHPYGVKFTSTTVTGHTPTNANLATATNWQTVYEPKNIGIVALKHKVAVEEVPAG